MLAAMIDDSSKLQSERAVDFSSVAILGVSRCLMQTTIGPFFSGDLWYE
jgi:hypothetical protein